MTPQVLLAIAVAALAGGIFGYVFALRWRPSDPEQPPTDLSHGLAVLSQRIDLMASNQTSDQSVISEQLRELARTNVELNRTTSSLSRSLNNTTMRGQWGEMQLRRIVEVAGLSKRVHFEEQATVSDVRSTLRPDLVVTLTDQRVIVVDSKVPLDALLRADEAEISAATAELHAQAVSQHIDQLASKQYWKQFDRTPQFVVLFLPVESLLQIALSARPELLESAFNRNVVIATPATMLALLRTIELGWRGYDVSENAEQIRVTAAELHDRLVTMTGHLSRVGASLDSAVGNYNKLVRSYESRVLVSSRKIVQLGVGNEDVSTPRVIDERTRDLSDGVATFPPSRR